MQKSVYLLFIKIARTRAVAVFLMEKNDTTSIFKARWYTKSKKEVRFYLQLPRLPTVTGPYHGQSM